MTNGGVVGEFEFYYSREILFKRWLRVALVAGLGWVTVWFRSPELPYVKEGFEVLFLLGTGLLLRKALLSGPQLIINSMGVCDKRLKIGTLSWSRINSSKLHEKYGATLLLISLHEDGIDRPRMGLFQRLMAKWYSLEDACDMWIDLSDLACDPKSVATTIDKSRMTSG